MLLRLGLGLKLLRLGPKPIPRAALELKLRRLGVAWLLKKHQNILESRQVVGFWCK